jgi:hypothetical protein
MFVKVYSYRIRPARAKEFLRIQERAGHIYRKHVAYRAVHLQKRDDPCQWLEIQWYSDEAAYRRSMELINAEPEIERLWREFQTVLDPEDRTIVEEYYNQMRAEGNLPEE